MRVIRWARLVVILCPFCEGHDVLVLRLYEADEKDVTVTELILM
jgi:hypothetical protein